MATHFKKTPFNNLHIPFWSVGDFLRYQIETKGSKKTDNSISQFYEEWRIKRVKIQGTQTMILWLVTNSLESKEITWFNHQKIQGKVEEEIQKSVDDTRIYVHEKYLIVIDSQEIMVDEENIPSRVVIKPGRYLFVRRSYNWDESEQGVTRQTEYYDHMGQVIKSVSTELFDDSYYGTKRSVYEIALSILQDPKNPRDPYIKKYHVTNPTFSLDGSMSIDFQVTSDEIFTLGNHKAVVNRIQTQRDQQIIKTGITEKVSTHHDYFIVGITIPIIIRSITDQIVNFESTYKKKTYHRIISKELHDYSIHYLRVLEETPQNTEELSVSHFNQLTSFPNLFSKISLIPPISSKLTRLPDIGEDNPFASESLESKNVSQSESFEPTSNVESPVTYLKVKANTNYITITPGEPAKITFTLSPVDESLSDYSIHIFENPFILQKNFSLMELSKTQPPFSIVLSANDIPPGEYPLELQLSHKNNIIQTLSVVINVHVINSQSKESLDIKRLKIQLNNGVPTIKDNVVTVFNVGKGASNRTKALLAGMGQKYPLSYLKCFNMGMELLVSGNYHSAAFYFHNAIFIIQNFLQKKKLWPLDVLIEEEISQFRHEIERLGKTYGFLAKCFVEMNERHNAACFYLKSGQLFRILPTANYGNIIIAYGNFAFFIENRWEKITPILPLLRYTEELEKQVPSTFIPSHYRGTTKVPPVPFYPGYARLLIGTYYKNAQNNEEMTVNLQTAIKWFTHYVKEYASEPKDQILAIRWLALIEAVLGDRHRAAQFAMNLENNWEKILNDTNTSIKSNLGPEFPPTIDIILLFIKKKYNMAQELLAENSAILKPLDLYVLHTYIG